MSGPGEQCRDECVPILILGGKQKDLKAAVVESEDDDEANKQQVSYAHEIDAHRQQALRGGFIC